VTTLVELVVGELLSLGVNAHGNYNYDDAQPRQRLPFVAVEYQGSDPIGQTYSGMAGADVERVLIGVYAESEPQAVTLARTYRAQISHLHMTDVRGVTVAYDPQLLAYVAVQEVSKIINR
jgi:hypothetical protein